VKNELLSAAASSKRLCDISNKREVDMCEHCFALRRAPTRRDLVTFTAAAAVATLIAPQAMAKKAKAVPKPQNVLPPDAALDRLIKGNARYVRGDSRRHDFAHEREVLSGGQNPFAAVLSCADSRIAPEYCFDTARGDLFVCRVAGNFASDEMVASLEYAVQVLIIAKIMAPNEKVEAYGPLPEAAVEALGLKPGEFRSA
jgi:carbonic anhydrase